MSVRLKIVHERGKLSLLYRMSPEAGTVHATNPEVCRVGIFLHSNVFQQLIALLIFAGVPCHCNYAPTRKGGSPALWCLCNLSRGLQGPQIGLSRCSSPIPLWNAAVCNDSLRKLSSQEGHCHRCCSRTGIYSKYLHHFGLQICGKTQSCIHTTWMNGRISHLA